MGITAAEFTISLDGFIAGPNDEIDALFGWYRAGDTEFVVPGTGMVFRVHRASAELMQAQWTSIGALVTGRRDFDVSNAWGGAPPLAVPTFIVTHRVPEEWVYEDSPFTFVPEGVESAVMQAKTAAGDGDVGVGGTMIVQQCLRLGLLDELRLHVVPVLLGHGIRLFDNLGPEAVQLETTKVIATPQVTHLQFRILN